MLDSPAAPSPIPDSALELRGWRLAAGAFCCLMLVLHVGAGWQSSGLTDFWRDMYWSTLIAHGERFPLAGPPINQIAELGPWWHYLLALPIFLSGRLAAAALTIQILAALKYFLAAHIGTRLVDARFGFAFAVCLAVAGWSIAPFMFPSHPAVVETAVLLLALATWRFCASLSFGNALLFGLAAAACLHAHPTTVLYAAAAGAIVLWRHRCARAVVLLAAAAAVVLLSLLPPWLDAEPVNEVWRRTLSAYAAEDIGNDLATRLPKVAVALSVGGAWVGLLLLTSWKLSTVKFAWWLYCACLLAPLAGLIALTARAGRLRCWTLAAAVFLLVQILFLLFARAWTPVWMVPSCLPPLAFVAAAGWYVGFSSPQRLPRRAALTAFAPYALLSLVPFVFFLRDIHGMRAMVHANPFGDIAQSDDAYFFVPGSPLPVRSIDALGALLCEPLTVHARLATAIERSLAASARNACGAWPDLRFAGTRPGAHLAGIAQRAADKIDIAPDRRAGGLALYSRVRAIAPVEGARRTQLQRMQVGIDAVHAPPSPLAYDFETGAGDIVVLTNRIPPAAPMTVREVEASGAPALLVHDEGSLRLYRCAACSSSGKANWRLRLDGVEANLDLVVLEKAPAP